MTASASPPSSSCGTVVPPPPPSPATTQTSCAGKKPFLSHLVQFASSSSLLPLELQDSFLTGGPSPPSSAPTSIDRSRKRGRTDIHQLPSIEELILLLVLGFETFVPSINSLGKCRTLEVLAAAAPRFFGTIIVPPPPLFASAGWKLKAPLPPSPPPLLLYLLAPCKSSSSFSCGFRLPEKMFVQKEKMPRK